MSRITVARLSAIAVLVALNSATSVLAREFYVSSNNRIEVFDTVGNSLGAIGEDDGFLSAVWDVELGPDGNLYVANSGRRRVEKYDTNGNYLGVYGETEVEGIQHTYPRALKFDEHGNLFALASNGGIRKFDAIGRDLGYFGSFSPTGFFDMRALDFDSSGNLYVAFSGTTFSNGTPATYGRVEVFAPNGTALGTFGETADAQLLAANGMDFDKDGRLCVSTGGGVRVFSPEGDGLGTFGETTILNALAGSGIEFDNDGNLYAADFEKVTRFDADGKSLGVFGETNSVRLSLAFNIAIREVPEPATGFLLLNGLLLANVCRRIRGYRRA